MYDELVKRLRRCEQFKCRECEYEQVVGCRSKLNAESVDAIEELNDNNVGKWIPVTERLPDENEDVLIYGEWTGVSGTKYREIWLTDLNSLLHQGYKPIAWMPLPAPPKEG